MIASSSRASHAWTRATRAAVFRWDRTTWQVPARDPPTAGAARLQGSAESGPPGSALPPSPGATRSVRHAEGIRPTLAGSLPVLQDRVGPVAVDAAHPWGDLEKLGWTIYVPLPGAMPTALCKACGEKSAGIMAAVAKAKKGRRRKYW
jgi:hypothetical protein